ncbi:hypothetical protein [Bradyrhizobium vignae]|nr:hypothetical protein [Bradyrhizobium vignae]
MRETVKAALEAALLFVRGFSLNRASLHHLVEAGALPLRGAFVASWPSRTHIVCNNITPTTVTKKPIAVTAAKHRSTLSMNPTPAKKIVQLIS